MVLDSSNTTYSMYFQAKTGTTISSPPKYFGSIVGAIHCKVLFAQFTHVLEVNTSEVYMKADLPSLSGWNNGIEFWKSFRTEQQ